MQYPYAAEPAAPPLLVSVEGLTFHYQFAEDDVKKVFSRYGDVKDVLLGPDGGSARVTYANFGMAMCAWKDLNGKPLAGIADAYLKVECPSMSGADQGGIANVWDQAVYGSGYFAHQQGPPPPVTGGVAAAHFASPPNGPGDMNGMAGPGKKYTCRLEIGIENEKEYRVGSKVIQVARKIWQELPSFQNNGGKTRLRGKGVGGPHESEEPLALCISCREPQCFEQAVTFAEQQLLRIHEDYKQFCVDRGYPIPELAPPKAVNDHAHASAPWRKENTGVKGGHEGGEQQQWGGNQNNGKGGHNKGWGGGKGGYNQQNNATGVWSHNNQQQNNMNGPNNQNNFDINKPQQQGGQQPHFVRQELSPTEVEKQIEDRNEARRNGDFQRADDIRDFLQESGVVLVDHQGRKETTQWRYWTQGMI